jgi:lambda family phage portal protein
MATGVGALTRVRRALSALWGGTKAGVQRSYYAGAQVNRLVLDWITSPVSADREIRADLTLLRARSRELVRNNGYARRYVALVANNVAGPHGITLHARNAFGTGKLRDDVNAEIEAKWADWGRAETCTADGRLSWAALQRLICTVLPQDGEALLQIVDVEERENPYGFALHVLDADQLDHTLNRPAQRDQNEIRMGVEIDARGKPVAYHLWAAHPADLNPAGRVRTVVPAEQIVHLYRPDRPGQTRGVPWFAAVMSDLKMLAGYQQAEVVAARTAAAKMAFIHDLPGAEASAPIDPNMDPATATLTDASPGVIDELPSGKGITFWDPSHPSGNFGPFTSSVLRSVASGLPGASYHALTNDYSQSNYSSSRMAEGENRDEWRSLQCWLIDMLHERVYREFLRRGLLLGSIALPTRDYVRWLAHEFQPRGWGYIDPKTDVETDILRIQWGLDSRRRINAAQGIENEALFNDLKAEAEAAADLGISITAAPTGQAPAADAAADTTDTTTDDQPARALQLARGLR